MKLKDSTFALVGGGDGIVQTAGTFRCRQKKIVRPMGAEAVVVDIKLMTYNIRHGAGPLSQGRVDLDRLVEVLTKHDADIVGLNEVYGRGLGLGFRNQVREIARRSGYPYYRFARAFFRINHAYGNAVLSKYPFESSETIRMLSWRREPRSVLKATFRLDESRGQASSNCDDPDHPTILTVLVTHLGLGVGERRESIGLLAKLVEESEGPCVLMGDFNVDPTDEVLAPILERMQDVAAVLGVTKPTFPTHSPRHKIDYILASAGVTILDADIPDDIASDHFPHTALISV